MPLARSSRCSLIRCKSSVSLAPEPRYWPRAREREQPIPRCLGARDGRLRRTTVLVHCIIAMVAVVRCPSWAFPPKTRAARKGGLFFGAWNRTPRPSLKQETPPAVLTPLAGNLSAAFGRFSFERPSLFGYGNTPDPGTSDMMDAELFGIALGARLRSLIRVGRRSYAASWRFTG
jgi:hypothetical protein